MKTLKLFFLFSFIASVVYSQNITNTLGTGGLFSIKDANINFLTLDQTTRQVNILNSLRLEVTDNSPTVGVIFKGADRFIHDYKPTGGVGQNTFVGVSSGNFTMTYTSEFASSCNTGLGYVSLSKLTTGSFNSGLGFAALFKNTTGHDNTGVGANSLTYNTTGYENTSAGSAALALNSTGNNNSAFGVRALYYNMTGFNNTSVGHHSLENNTGNYNTALGYNAGSAVTTGANLTLLGIDANPSSPTALDQITLGNTFVNSLRCNVQNISSLSDARDKKNIKDLDLGIDFLMKVKPRFFNWDKREWYADNKSDGSKMKETPTAGFIAQELDEVQNTENAEWLNLVLKDNPEKLEATPGNLLPVIVKAIQDLKKENDKLKSINYKLIDRLNNFEQMQNKMVAEIQKMKTEDKQFTKASLGE